MIDCNPETNGELRLATLLVPRCRVVFDVGVRQDDHLVQLNDHCEFHLFEPNAGHCQALAAKVGLRPNVTVNPLALGNRRGTSWMYPDTESLVKRPHSQLEPVTIALTRLDDYCRERNIPHIDFLKIDTEGFELEVLKGGREIVHRATRVIQFEYGGTYADAGITLEMVFDFLGPQWCYYRIRPQRLVRIKSCRRRYEDGCYTNYVASREPLPPEIVGRGIVGRLLFGRRSWSRAA
jgi:FkbM family methyltransferase